MVVVVVTHCSRRSSMAVEWRRGRDVRVGRCPWRRRPPERGRGCCLPRVMVWVMVVVVVVHPIVHIKVLGRRRQLRRRHRRRGRWRQPWRRRRRRGVDRGTRGSRRRNSWTRHFSRRLSTPLLSNLVEDTCTTEGGGIIVWAFLDLFENEIGISSEARGECGRMAKGKKLEGRMGARFAVWDVLCEAWQFSPSYDLFRATVVATLKTVGAAIGFTVYEVNYTVSIHTILLVWSPRIRLFDFMYYLYLNFLCAVPCRTFCAMWLTVKSRILL